MIYAIYDTIYDIILYMIQYTIYAIYDTIYDICYI